ncbi:MAG: hypothetical protein LBG79_03505 [Spirochaetaceae bacterium]|jgi:hypothetical protein|nr:hypothetical protein [Spirochaetaceae bacterium]
MSIKFLRDSTIPKMYNPLTMLTGLSYTLAGRISMLNAVGALILSAPLVIISYGSC